MAYGRYIKKMIKSVVQWSLKDEPETRIRYDEPSMAISATHSMGSNSIKGSAGVNANGMNFTVYAATGGKVIEFKIYDPTRDRHTTNLYVVTDKEDLGEELGQIITKESLCR